MRQENFRITLTAAALLAGLTGCSQQDAQQVRQAVTPPEQHLIWSGDVDDSATVFVQSARSWSDDVTGKGVQNVVAQFQGTLPSSEATVSLKSKSGRGQVEITQQPTKDNNYTAGVRIIDPQAGSEHYQFVLTW